MSPRTRAKAQLALDETIVEDDELERVLARRAEAAEAVSEHRLVFQKYDEEAKGLIERHDLGDEDVIRVGGWRISKRITPAGHREFDVKAKARLTIKAVTA